MWQLDFQSVFIALKSAKTQPTKRLWIAYKKTLCLLALTGTLTLGIIVMGICWSMTMDISEPSKIEDEGIAILIVL